MELLSFVGKSEEEIRARTGGYSKKEHKTEKQDWRKDYYATGAKFGVNPDDYETEMDFALAMNEAIEKMVKKSYSKDDYSYLTYLDCPDYSNIKENNELKPNITIDMTSPTKNTVKKVKTDVTINDDSKLLSYSITIYRDKNDDGNENEVYTTGNVEANYETNITKSKDIAKFTPGKIKVVVKATNIYGNSETLTKTETYKDKQGPTCIFYPEYDFSNDDWVSADRKVTVGCDDGEEGSGCARETFTQTFKKDAETGVIKIKDNAGNETPCTVKVHVDKTSPETCSVTHTGEEGLNDWYVSNATVNLIDDDKMSGVKYKSLTTSSTEPTSAAEYNGKKEDTQTEIATIKWYGYLEDKAGNKTKCESTSFKVDTTAPTKPSGGSITLPGSTKNVNLSEVSSSTDATSGVMEYRYVVKNNATAPANSDSGFTTSTAFTRKCGTSYYAYAIAVDKAGNKSAVYKIGNKSDGADKYSDWSSCSKKCGSGTKTRTNTCALVTTDLSKSCNTQGCCSSTTTDWDDWGSCNVSCGDGKQYRSGTKISDYDGRDCGDDSDSRSCNAGSCEPPPHDHDWNCRPASTHSVTWSNCTGGCGTHTTGFYILCCECGARKTSRFIDLNG
jgi:hypothetical protein